MHHLLDATPLLTAEGGEVADQKFGYLLAVLTDCDLDPLHCPRLNPRVVMSKRKTAAVAQRRNLEAEMEILPLEPAEADKVRLCWGACCLPRRWAWLVLTLALSRAERLGQKT